MMRRAKRGLKVLSTCLAWASVAVKVTRPTGVYDLPVEPLVSSEGRVGMASDRRIGAPDAKNRGVLLDAAEQLMLEDGYAAVT